MTKEYEQFLIKCKTLLEKELNEKFENKDDLNKEVIKLLQQDDVIVTEIGWNNPDNKITLTNPYKRIEPQKIIITMLKTHKFIKIIQEK